MKKFIIGLTALAILTSSTMSFAATAQTPVQHLTKPEIETGSHATYKLTSDGKVFCKGTPSYGKLGLGDSVNSLNGAQWITEFKDMGVSNIVDIDVHTFGKFIYMLSKDGRVFVTGQGTSGENGLGTKKDVYTVAEIQGLPKIKKISAGYNHALLLDEEGSAYATGSLLNSQTGIPYKIGNATAYTPIKVPLTGKVKNVLAGHKQSFFVMEDGKTIAFGNGWTKSTFKGDSTELPFKNLKNVASFEFHNLYTTESNEYYASGTNEHGQLGLGFKGDEVVIPTKLKLTDVVKAEAGNRFSVFLHSDGTASFVGGNLKSVGSEKVFGPAYNGMFDTETLVKAKDKTGKVLENIIDVSASTTHIAFLLSDGSVLEYGLNGK